MNISIRNTVIIIMSLLLLAVNGCAHSDVPKDKMPEDQQVIYHQNSQSITPELAVAEDPDKYEILESDKIPGWKKLKARVSLSELTEHGSQPINDNKKYGFSIHFPGSWTMISSVLYDANNKKVGEIPPAILLKTGQAPVFLDYKPAIDNGEELISKEKIKINTYQGSKTITTISTESGSWYPHIYRLTDEDYGFTIFLYSEGMDTDDQALFDRIINTFSKER